ncbi:MAG: hypothetical protein AB1656_11330 [Candidatus Omnitrophota bacterium]
MTRKRIAIILIVFLIILLGLIAIYLMLKNILPSSVVPVRNASQEQSGESSKIAQSVIDAALTKAQEIRNLADKMRLPIEAALSLPGLKSSEIKGKGRYLNIEDSDEQKTMKMTYIDNKLVDLFVEDSNKKSYVIHYQDAGVRDYLEMLNSKANGCILFFHKNLQIESYTSVKDGRRFGPYFLMNEKGEITQSGVCETPADFQIKFGGD